MGAPSSIQLDEVIVPTVPLDRFRDVVGEERFARGLEAAALARNAFAGRVLWNVNSTAVGGGVAEMLRALLPYVRGAGVDTRWAVIRGDSEFFRITKRIHHALHGDAGDGSPLDAAALAHYDAVSVANARELLARVRRGDIVILHDPQTAGLAEPLVQAGALVLWRSHIGTEIPNAETECGWWFLARYLSSVHGFVFSRAEYIPACIPRGRCIVVPPSIDPFSPKNEDLAPANVCAILGCVGIVACTETGGVPVFRRTDGSPGRVDRGADILRHGPIPTRETPLVVQVSRWDLLKDPLGVMHGFSRVSSAGAHRDAQLVLAGPNVRAVADDPDGARVFEEVAAAWRALPHDCRRCVQLVNLPTADVEENAAMVNALQRHAAVIVQKSLREGFGLTVTEAMWKARPVVASAVGGILDQIEDGVSGLLVRDPTNLDEFAAAVRRPLEDRALAVRLGTNAREAVRARFLGIRHLEQYAELIAGLMRTVPADAPRDTPPRQQTNAPAPTDAERVLPHSAPRLAR